MKYFFRALAHPLLTMFGPDVDFYFICGFLGLVDAIILFLMFQLVGKRFFKKSTEADVEPENPANDDRKPTWLEILPLMLCVFLFTEALINFPIFSGDFVALNFGLIIFLVWAGFVWGLWLNISKKFRRG